MFLGIALGAWLLTIQPVGAQTPTPVIMDYPENSDRTVG